MTGWRLISTLPDIDTDIVLWNPCDGIHIYSTLLSTDEVNEIRKGKIFTHWQRLKPPKTTDEKLLHGYLRDGRIGPNEARGFRPVVIREGNMKKNLNPPPTTERPPPPSLQRVSIFGSRKTP